ncbi:acetylcholine receptor subunit alpha-like isoform X4 [Musca domestica]|uniref:Acetylcholine receptor subunit alpha-like isoform X4 n=1 Tax=Musca domestica TaxID=7370 RepID=A0ABM3VAL3_MUSDO|nr:acetylcholine receptor subunit alpha-like isoform X4 [Musca domestica]
MKSITGEKIRTWLLSALMVHGAVAGNPDAKRLYDDLLSNYNKLVRPVVNTTDVLKVCIKLKLSQLIDVNLKNQIMTTNLWVEQSWYDYKLRWEPKEYGGVHMLHVPSDHIWRPDIVLYNNADGHYEVTLMTKATVHNSGLVIWQPPAVYKSSCSIDVEYFPYDVQTCILKLGSWTYDGFKVDLRHMDEQLGSNVVDVGVDLSEFYMSVEWDILEVPAVSICVTVVVLNVHFRSPQTHRMAPWVKNVFIDSLPKFLFIKRPKYNFETSLTSTGPFGGSCQIHGLIPSLAQSESDDLPVVPDMEIGPSGIKSPILANPVFSHTNCPPSVHRSCFCVQFISEHTRMQEDSTKVKEDWKYVAMVLDRLFLWIFTLAVLAGTAGIILQAPTLYDDRIPIIEQKDVDFSGNSAGRCRPPQ